MKVEVHQLDLMCFMTQLSFDLMSSQQSLTLCDTTISIGQEP